ncbi:MAG: thioredoxin family protein [Actinomycetota bacterium]|nr:thioredoxin family protein [Actinomycetota bacterium]
MADTITILHTPDCPNVTLVRERLADALARLPGPAPRIVVEEIADPEDAIRRRFHGSPALLIDGIDPFAPPESPPAFACRTYRTGTGVEGAPSVDQIVAALTAG